VFVIDDGRAQRREVTLGKRSGLHSQVLSGLVEGQEVILHPDESIESGTRVQRRN
jgi:HlyD family secretion protein